MRGFKSLMANINKLVVIEWATSFWEHFHLVNLYLNTFATIVRCPPRLTGLFVRKFQNVSGSGPPTS